MSLPTALTAISTKIQSADPMRRQRALRRLAAAVLVVLYARRTNQSLGQQRVLLAQDEQLPPSEQLRAALRYTIWGQLIASSEYLLCLVKPALAARIGRLLVRTPRDAVANLTYGPNDRNTLDLYGVGGAPKPVIVFMHGGAWSFGHKWQYALVGEYLATQGFLVAVVNYRTFPAGSVMDMVEDIENAVRTRIVVGSGSVRVHAVDWYSCRFGAGVLGRRSLPSVRRRQKTHLSERPLVW